MRSKYTDFPNYFNLKTYFPGPIPWSTSQCNTSNAPTDSSQPLRGCKSFQQPRIQPMNSLLRGWEWYVKLGWFSQSVQP